MKLGQLIEHNTEIFFFKNYAENKEGSLVPDLCLVLKKASYEVNASGIEPTFYIIALSIHGILWYTIKLSCLKL